MSAEAKGYPHKQSFNLSAARIQKSLKHGWWLVGYRKAEQPKKKD